MKHDSEFAAIEPGFGKLPDAPMAMPKQALTAPQRPWFMLVLLSLLTLARSRS